MINIDFDFLKKRVSINTPKNVKMHTADALVKIQKRLHKKGFQVKFKMIAA